MLANIGVQLIETDVQICSLITSLYDTRPMSSRRQVLTAGTIALVLAVAIIAAAAILVPPSTTSSITQAGTTQVGSSQTQISTGPGQTSLGQLDVLLTDPPTVPDGVTAIYVTYSNVAVHVSGAGNQSGWTNANTSGTIDLMKMVNVSTTIAAVKVTSGVYNALRFNISSAAVTYDGVNYTAFVPHAEITVLIPGGIQVNATKSSAAIIDMHPTVLNIGSKSDPEFIIDAAASCFEVPPIAFTKGMDHWGFTMSLGNMQWWTQINERYTANIQITGATLSENSFSVTINNTGSGNISLSAISLMPLGSECGPSVTTSTSTTGSTSSKSAATSTTATTRHEHTGQQYRLPICFSGSALFVVLDNGTLRLAPGVTARAFPLQSRPGPNPSGIFENAGYELVAGQSVTLTFSGPISFGFSLGRQSAPGVISGDQYDVTVVGPQALAQYVVVAS